MNEGQRVHFVGIGGIGMSGIARVLLQMGWTVSGSDLKESSLTANLQELGGTIFIGHAPENVENADIIVLSSAIKPTNPEVKAAQERNLPIYGRSEMLGFLMRQRFGIAIAGTHGKTTTTSMIAILLEANDLRPTVLVGGELNDIGSNAKLGLGPHLVAEADESDASFLDLDPKIAVVTNVDSDVNLSAPPFAGLNFDYEATMAKINEMFLEFMHRVPPTGKLVLCWDQDNLRSLIPQVDRPYITYGLEPGADLTATHVQLEGFGSTSCLMLRGQEVGILRLRVPGRHNIQNALAAVAVGLEVGLPLPRILAVLEAFEGVQRRFQILGEYGGVTVVDDYAHNPAKVQAALHGAKAGAKGRVIGVFQPHRYTRTKFLAHEFATSFTDADVLLVSDIYSAGEVPIVGVKSEMLIDLIRRHGNPKTQVVYTAGQKEMIDYLTRESLPGDVVVTLGAGDVGKWGARLCDFLAQPLAQRPAM